MRSLLPYVLITCFGVFLAGCGGRDAVEPEDEYTEIEVVDGTAGASASGITEGESGAVVSGLEGETTGEQVDAETVVGGSDSGLLDKRVVYFEYNSSLLTLEAEAVAQAHAQYLVSNPGIQVILEGHADERGTREYNLALGEDRAKTVANAMEVRGVSPSRIQIVSYGEERPVALGSDEAAWALNRRVEILYQ